MKEGPAMRRRISFVEASGALAFLLQSVPAEATIFTWKLAGSGLTNLNTNWSPLGVPGADDDTRFLQNGITYTITTHSPADTFATVTAGGSGNPQFSCGDPLRVRNTFTVNGGVTASIISGVARAGAFTVGPGTFTITGNGTQAIATNAVLTNVFGSGSGTSTVNVNGGASLTGGYFEMPSVASATAILNVSDHPA